ncbi:MAG: glycoside hydrolase, partial [Clostridia bacterium]|nr:glycoside hydrolase [Clostridia bacterium]
GSTVPLSRVDMGMGIFAFVYNDDLGHTWSGTPREIPIRPFAIDRRYPLFAKGKERFLFWNVSSPAEYRGNVYIPLSKIASSRGGCSEEDEGVFLFSPNLSDEKDPDKLIFRTLPDGENGVSAFDPSSAVAEEHCLAVLSDGSLFDVFRTDVCRVGFSQSFDGGKTFTPSRPLTYEDGTPVPHPRANCPLFSLGDGKYLLWHHCAEDTGYGHRNRVYLSGAEERDIPEGETLTFHAPKLFLENDTPEHRGLS